MRTLALRAALGVCLFAGNSFPAGPNGSSASPYPQILCVVPMVGAGTVSDPRRPMFAPVAGQPAEEQRPSKGFVDPAAITSYRSVVSDDGLFAIVVFEARDRAAFRPILASRSLLKKFDLANTPLDTLLPTLRTLKKNFNLRMLQGGAL